MSTLQASSNTKHVRSSGQDEFRCQILKPLYIKRDSSKQLCDQTGAVYFFNCLLFPAMITIFVDHSAVTLIIYLLMHL
jgi:hypothetical protein